MQAEDGLVLSQGQIQMGQWFHIPPSGYFLVFLAGGVNYLQMNGKQCYLPKCPQVAEQLEGGQENALTVLEWQFPMLRYEPPSAEAWSSGAHPTLAWERSLYGQYLGVPGAGKSHRTGHLWFPRVSIK